MLFTIHRVEPFYSYVSDRAEGLTPEDALTKFAESESAMGKGSLVKLNEVFVVSPYKTNTTLSARTVPKKLKWAAETQPPKPVAVEV